jgi:hypothetical protein
VGTRRAIWAVTAVVVALAVLATSCSRTADTGEVSAAAPDDVSLQTSTTVAAGGSGGSGSSSRSSARTAVANSEDLTKLVAQLASDPQLLAQLAGMDLTQIAALTGTDPAVLARLNITPDTIRALASVLAGMNPSMVKQLADGKVDPELASTILMLAAQLDPAAAIAIKGVDPLAIASLLSAATTVDPKVVSAIGGVLKVADPDGLGRLADDESSLAILAVLFGVALRTDPSKFAQLANAANLDPNVNFVLSSISNLAAGLTPQVVYALNGLSKVLGPDLLRALSAMLGILGRPDIAPIVQAAAADPVVLVSTFGTFALLIPGLAEALAPDVFEKNPNARYGILAGLIGVAIANLNGLDLNALAQLLGLPPLSPDFER